MLTSVGVPVDLKPEPLAPDSSRPTLICFSHLRWNFVFQRPQHLMSRFARDMSVVFWEDPVEIGRRDTAFLKVRQAEDQPNVRVVTPHLPEGLRDEQREEVLGRLLDAHLTICSRPLVAWYYTPMMLSFSKAVDASLTVYDCMDELSKFRFAPERLLDLETELLERADIVFTGGSSLYESKKGRHDNVHCFPSSVDHEHFARARGELPQPADQAGLPRPRLGFYGVIDERFDIDLLRQVADMRPGWSFVMIGPVAKIGEDELPRAANIHYLGSRTYEQLPTYLSGWDVALMPFAMNESTQFISPTKTPEYLAGGRPVVSTPVRDVVRHYGRLEGVHIAADADGFVRACEQALEQSRDREGVWLAEADLVLAATSWDTTQARMAGLVLDAIGIRTSSDEALLVAAE